MQNYHKSWKVLTKNHKKKIFLFLQTQNGKEIGMKVEKERFVKSIIWKAF
jgi:hypothetical protein